MLKEHVGSIDFKVKGSVLILVLMEYAQRDRSRFGASVYKMARLNPYFNGTCSKSNSYCCVCYNYVAVLILVLVEYAQKSAYNVLNNLKSLVS